MADERVGLGGLGLGGLGLGVGVGSGGDGVLAASSPSASLLRPFLDAPTDAANLRKRRMDVRSGGLSPALARGSSAPGMLDKASAGGLDSPSLLGRASGTSNVPSLQLFSASAPTNARMSSSTFAPSLASTLSPSLSTALGGRGARDPEQEPEFIDHGARLYKRSRTATPFEHLVLTPNTGGGDKYPLMSASRTALQASSRDPSELAITREEQFEALKESSQNLMEVLSISQQNTQECTQTMEESPSMCVIRLVLHPDVERTLTAYQKNALIKKGLYRIEMQLLSPRLTLGRESYTHIFDKKTSSIDPIKLSRQHCTIECSMDPATHHYAVYITDKSTNGIRINGKQVDQGKKYKLEDGQKITLLSSRHGNVLLGYVVEDPHVRGAEIHSTQDNRGHRDTNPHASAVSLPPESQERSQVGRNFQEYTLGVLFSAPLVGKDIQGRYHPIAELDVKREYSILQQSLIEASKYAKRSADDDITAGADARGPNGSRKKVFFCPRQISVCAKFANTENFRTMVTIGCRALHFSGHGDEKHLYFEDGMGLVHPIPHDSLQELFTAGGGSEDSPLRLAFVSACSSAPLANAFVACGIPHVIGVKTNQKIEDYAAIEFTRSFYLALATGKSVGASFTIAQQSVAKSPNIRGPNAVAEKFLLLPEDGDHSEVIFPLAAVEAQNTVDLGAFKPKRYPKLWFDDLPAICQGFCNRATEVYKICLALMLTQTRITRLVTVIGEEGIGKTAVAYAVANYVGPRITSEGGVKFISVVKLAQEEADKQADMARRHINIGAVVNRVLSRLETIVADHLRKHRQRIEFNAQQMLVVLDGCDCLLRDARRDRFRSFLSELLTNNPCLKIVLTARTAISTDGAVAGHGERVYSLTRFNAKMSTKMLVSLVSRPIRIDELKRSRLPNSTDKLELIAAHPALLATLGIPKRIADLGGKLNEMLMDSIPIDEAAAMEMNNE